MLESARYPFYTPWWTAESSADASPSRRNNPSSASNLGSRLKMESDDHINELDLAALAGAGKKLQWISREEHRSSARNSSGNDRPSIQNGFVQGRSSRLGVAESPGRGIHIPFEMSALQNGSANGRSARLGVSDSPGRGMYIPSEMSALQNGFANARYAESPGRGIHSPFELSALPNGSANGRSARLGVSDSPGRGMYVPSELSALQNGSAHARYADSPGRGIHIPYELSALHNGSANARYADSPGRGIHTPLELSSIQNGYQNVRSARFGVSDSPGRGVHTPLELSSIQNGSAKAGSARFGVSDSPGRGVHTPLDLSSNQNGSANARSARFGVADSPGRGIHTPLELSSIQNGSGKARSARFGVDSPGRGTNIPTNIPAELSALQNGIANLRSARSVVPDSPGRGMYNAPPESPARRGESVRQIRTPSTDVDMTEVPSRRLRSVSHQPRSASFQEGDHTVTKGDRTVIREASALRRLSTSRAPRDQRTPPNPRAQPAANNSPRFTPISDSPEDDGMVVSYLAEETDRIIKGRIRKLNLRSNQSNAAADQPRPTDSERISAGVEGRNSNVVGRHGSNSFRLIDKINAERVVDSRDKHRGGGGIEHESEIFAGRPGTQASSPGSPLPSPSSIGQVGGPTGRTISATMENYLESRRKGSNLGPQINVSTRPAAAAGHGLPPTAFHPNLAVLRQTTQQPENPSTSSKSRVGRHDSFTASGRAALSPLNGNEGVTHSTSLSQSKEEAHGEDPNRGRRKDANESAQVEGENGFPSRQQYWAEFLGKRELESTGLRHLTQETAEELTSPSGRKELGTKIAPVRFYANGARVHPPHGQDRRQRDSYARHSALGTHSQRYEEVGRSLLVEKGGPRDSSAHSQSCRRDPIIHPLLEPSQKNEALLAGKLMLPSGFDTSSDSKSSRRFSVDIQMSSSSETPQDGQTSSSLAHIEKAKFIFKDSPGRKGSWRLSVAAPDADETTFSGSGDSLPDPPQFRKPSEKPRHHHQRTPSRAHSNRAPHKDSSSVESQPSSEKKKHGSKMERPRMPHKSSVSLDEDSYKKIMVHTKSDNSRSRQPPSSSTSVFQVCSNSPRATKAHHSPGISFQRWIANQFRSGSKSRSSSTGKTRERQEEPKEEPKPRKKSPWRTRPAEIFQVITRKKGSSTRAQGAPLLDAHGLQNLRQRNLSGCETQAQLNRPDPWHYRMKDSELGNTAPLHRSTYFLPSALTTSSPARSRGLHKLFKTSRPG